MRYRELFLGPLGRRTAMLIVVWVFQTLGFYGFTAWVPSLLVQHGFDLTKALWFTALTTLGAVPGALLAWPISDRFGRKVPIVVVAIAIAVCGLAYGLTFNTVAIVVFGFCVNALVRTFAALLYADTPELFPTEQRNSGNGLAYGTGRLANIFGYSRAVRSAHRHAAPGEHQRGRSGHHDPRTGDGRTRPLLTCADPFQSRLLRTRARSPPTCP